MRTFAEYQQKLNSMRKNVYIDGQLVGRDDPRLLGGQHIMQLTFDAALSDNDALRNLVTTKSHLTGQTVNRFAHIYHSVDDMLQKQKMVRTFSEMAGGCVQRCMGCDALNALYVSTYEIDQKYGTEYHERFKKYLKWYQENDMVGNAGQTDVKGDRSKRPSEQVDPDLYMRIVERREDGIIVSAGDVEKLFEKLKILYMNLELRKAVAFNGKKKVLKNFDIKYCTGKLLIHYQEI